MYAIVRDITNFKRRYPSGVPLNCAWRIHPADFEDVADDQAKLQQFFGEDVNVAKRYYICGMRIFVDEEAPRVVP